MGEHLVVRRLAAILAFLLPLGAGAQVAQRAAMTNPHGAGLTRACATCHTANTWKPAKVAKGFAHAEKVFPLSGAHESAPCASCHKTLDFKVAAKTCASCHRDVHKGELGTDCARCHTSRSFVDRGSMTRMHQLTRFPLRAAHAVVACESCHLPTRAGQLQFVKGQAQCASCHMGTFRTTDAPPHLEPSFSRDCTSCHKTSTWKGATFDHSQTLFPLSGGHRSVECAACHADKQFHGRSLECNSCHQKDYAKTTNPPHAQGFPTTCTSCHTTERWNDAKFDHAQGTRFPLTGAHRAATCSGCHGDKVFRGKSMECVTCHQAAYNSTTTPKHAAAGFATTCQSCHSTTQWKGAPFDHNAATRFPLSGAHRAATCASCHADDVYRGKPMTCLSCHQAAYNSTATPPHAAAGFATTCQSCHTTTQWKGAPFDHDAATRFPLTGAHRATTCATCHADGVYRGKPSTCASCHQAAYAATTTPPHAAAKFATTCQSCHTTTQWKGAPFDHNTTLFPLTGAHRSSTCLECHADKVYVGKSTTCASCHQQDFDRTTTPNHRTSGFSANCLSCHNTTQWKGAVFDHAVTKFPLTGAHRATTCTGCHADNVFAGKPTTCVSCHQANYNATKAPAHVPAGFPTTCETCHTTTQWLGAPFDHAKTQFPLTGAHRATTCDGCHADKVYNGKPTTCVSCHQSDYNGTTTPNHKAAGFPTACEGCHTTTQWPGAVFDHAQTSFALTGAHRAAPCASCHADGVYNGKPTTCVSCHQTEYNGTTNPNHRTQGFPATCEGCHTTTQWTGATFNHNATLFPLTGAHTAATCVSCHADGVYKGKPTTCVSCHQVDYTATTRPPHGPSNIPTQCQTCHTTAAWQGAPYNHALTAFPLTGAHQAATCMDCHSDGVYKGKPQTCITCHNSDWSASTNPHHAAAGFATQCQTCHTTVQWKGGTYNHNATAFPLTGAHIPEPCISCHASKVYKGLPSTCVSCHLADYNATTNPRHATANFPTTCVSCHTTTQWQGATFNHDGSYFPIYSGKHRGKWSRCSDCHINATNYKVFECILCHEHNNKTKVDNDHKGKSGYQYVSVKCLACHPKGD